MNLEDLKPIPKPWGSEIIWAQTENYVGKVLKIKAGSALSLQHHEEKEETMLVLSGEVIFYSGNNSSSALANSQELKAGDIVHIAPGVIHRLVALIDAEVLEVSTPQLNDIVRHKDLYGRVNKVVN